VFIIFYDISYQEHLFLKIKEVWWSGKLTSTLFTHAKSGKEVEIPFPRGAAFTTNKANGSVSALIVQADVVLQL